MNSEKVTFHQMMFSIVLFNFGSSVVMGISGGILQDTWVSLLIGAALATPLFVMYARIFRLFPEKDLFAILQLGFGKIGGKIFTALLTWYAVHLSALVLRNFSEFTQVCAMPETPQLPIMIVMVLVTIYLARSDMRSVGKWSAVILWVVLSVVALTFTASVSQLRIENFMPFFEHTPAQIAKSAFEIFSFPYAESVLFLCVAGSFSKKDNPYKLFLYALGIILVVFLLVFLRNLTLLGPTLMSLNYFPSYVAARIIGVSDFLARIEGSISSNFLFAGITKITVCLLAASKGLASLFELKRYQSIVLPVGMLVLAICAILYQNVMEMFAFIAHYPYYAFLFQVIIPLAVWIRGEFYAKKRRLSDQPGS